MAGDFNLYKNGCDNLSTVTSTSHVTTGSATIATADMVTGPDVKSSNETVGSVYAAYKDLWERLNDGQEGLLTTLTTTEIGSLSGVSDGVQLIDKTKGHIETCIGGAFVHPGEEGGVTNEIPTTIQTTDNTQTVIYTRTLLDDEIYLFIARVVGEKADHSSVAGFTIECTAQRNGGGSASIEGGTTVIHSGKGSGATVWSTTFTVSGNDLRVSVSGQNSTTINWKCFTNFVEF